MPKVRLCVTVREKTVNKWNRSIQIDKWIHKIDGFAGAFQFSIQTHKPNPNRIDSHCHCLMRCEKLGFHKLLLLFY